MSKNPLDNKFLISHIADRSALKFMSNKTSIDSNSEPRILSFLNFDESPLNSIHSTASKYLKKPFDRLGGTLNKKKTLSLDESPFLREKTFMEDGTKSLSKMPKVDNQAISLMERLSYVSGSQPDRFMEDMLEDQDYIEEENSLVSHNKSQLDSKLAGNMDNIEIQELAPLPSLNGNNENSNDNNKFNTHGNLENADYFSLMQVSKYPNFINNEDHISENLDKINNHRKQATSKIINILKFLFLF